MSQITTHVLDTTSGNPAKGIVISLQEKDSNSNWDTLSSGITNQDGRISDLLSKDDILKPGIYRMVFETKSYFEELEISSFYPLVTVVFEITDDQHYHIPLLLSPYGYSTYRGS